MFLNASNDGSFSLSWSRCLGLSSLFLLFLVNAIYAQQLHFQSYSVPQGLPQAQVYDVYQDETGYLWVATNQGGIARFDGVEFEHFSKDHGLISNRTFCITRNPGGQLLIGTNNGLSIFHDTSFVNYEHKDGIQDNVILSFFNDNHGNTWIGSRYGITLFDGTRFTKPFQQTELPLHEVKSIIKDRKGQLWAGTINGLFQFESQRIRNFTVSNGLRNNTINALTLGNDGRIWIGTDEGLNVYENGSIDKPVFDSNQPAGKVTDIIQASDSTIWVGTMGEGLFRIRNGKITQITSARGLPHHYILSLTQDREGNIWIGSDGGGLALLKQTPFTSLHKADGLSSEIVMSVIKDRQGQLWMGTSGGGVVRYKDGQARVIDTKSGLGSNRIFDIREDKQGNIWMASDGGGLQVYNGRSFRSYTTANGFPSNDVRYIFLEGDREYWAATAKGVVHSKDGRIKTYGLQQGLLSERTRVIFRDSHGTIWVGTEGGGVSSFDGNAFTNYSTQNGLNDNVVMNVVEDKWNNLWFGTFNGISRFDGQSFKTISREEGLASKMVYSLSIDKAGFLWIGTSRGLDRLDLALYHFSDKISIKHFGQEEGFNGIECNQNAVFQDDDGSIWFGTIAGAIKYDPKKDIIHKTPPAIHIKRFGPANSQTSFPDNAILDSDQNDLTFEFIGIYFTSPGNVRYTFFLEGLDKRWNEPTHTKKVSYTQLPPGDYTFHIKALNQDGISMQEPVKFSFSIRKPFWQSLWFFLLCLGGIVVLSFVIGRAFKAYKNEYITTRAAFNHSLYTGRLLLFIGAFLYFIVGAFFDSMIEEVDDPMIYRMLICFLLLATFIGTFFIPFFRANISSIILFLFYLITTHSLYLINLTQIHPAYLLGFVVLMSVTTVIINDVKGFLWYAIYVMLATIIIAFIQDEPLFNQYLYVITVATVCLVTFITITVRLNLTSRLEFSDKIINNVDALVLVSDKNGEILFCSQNVKDILGYSEQEVLGSGWWSIRSEHDMPNALKKRELRDIARGSGGKVGIPYDTLLTKKSGEPVWLQWVDNALPGGLIIGVAVDVTERKKMEEELQKLSIVASKTDNSIIITDAQTRIEWVNDGFTRLTGFTAEEVLGKRPADFLEGPMTSKEVSQKILSEFRSKKPFSEEIMNYTKSGELYWVSFNVTPILNTEGKIQKFISIAIDITEKKKTEEQLKAYSVNLELLHKIDSTIINIQTVQQTFKKVLLHMSAYVKKCDEISIGIIDPNTRKIRLIHANGTDTGQEGAYGEMPVAGLDRLSLLENNEAIFIDDNHRSEQALATEHFHFQPEIRSVLITPLFINGMLIGSLNMGSLEPEVFDNQDINLARDIANSLAVALQKRKLEEQVRQKNIDITDSINYAKRIQDAHLPNLQELENYLEHFVLYLPRDIVSGDFYWYSIKEDQLIIAIADCTGHGVPGAFITLIGMNYLNAAVKEKNISDPAEILSYLHQGIKYSIGTSSETVKMDDGMDIALVKVDLRSGHLEFAGAFRSIYFVHEGKLAVLKGERFSIGEHEQPADVSFTTHRIPYQKGDKLYMFTDGFADQFGGPRLRKFTSKRFKQILLDNHDQPMKEQKLIIEQSLYEWMLDEPQVDDILVMGISL